MVVLPVNDGSKPIPGVALHTLPDVQHRSTGGIHQHTTDGAEALEVSHGHAEGRHDHDVIRSHGREIEISVLTMTQERNAHVTQLLVHVRVVDDLTEGKNPPLGKLGSSLIGILDAAIHPVTKADLAGQSEGQPAYTEA